MTPDFDWSSDFALDLEYGFANKGSGAARLGGPQLVVNSNDNTMLRALREELKSASRFAFSVAFVSPGAISLLKQELVAFGGGGVIVTSDYLGFNSPGAFRELLALREFDIDVRLHTQTAFHPKGYIFEHPDRVTMILGSSNLTKNALVSNHEWNLRVTALDGSDLGEQIDRLLEGQIKDSVPLTSEWVDAYEETWVRAPSPSRMRVIVGQQTPMPDPASALSDIVPNSMQLEALSELRTMRVAGKDKAILISATGTGKTILSALDVRAVNPDRFLFIVHREQILDKAIQEYQRVLGAPHDQFGKISGSARDLDARYIFATRQSISRDDVLAELDPTAFEYILIDEAHGAASSSYRKILGHFRPTFLLGMTATPERTDGADLFELFDYNVAYEIRLNRALEENMLVPFHYFGVADYTTDDGETIDDFTDLADLLSADRVEHILRALKTYGHKAVDVRGLIFCRSKREAHDLSKELSGRVIDGKALRTRALTGDDSIEAREAAVAALERGDLDYLLTVDIFNEGIDIPSINQVVMLRQTQSAIIFVQQLGRGLRLAPDKEFLIVIDFIGNYANNYMIPIALFGDQSLNKESVRKSLIAAEEIGVVSGLSSVRFDDIAQQRVLDSIATAKLNSLANLKIALEDMRARLGRAPKLSDFHRFSAADPIVLATADKRHYPALLERLLHVSMSFSEAQSGLLTLLCHEVLPAKRAHEAIIVKAFLERPRWTMLELLERVKSVQGDANLSQLESALRSLTHEFYVEGQAAKYGEPAVRVDGDVVCARGPLRDATTESDATAGSSAFRKEVEDIVETTLAIVADRYSAGAPFVPGREYTRKDASRLLCWQKNGSGTIFGYRTDWATRTCPIFVTLEKSATVGESTDYGDRLLSSQQLHWFSKSRKTLQSSDVKPIVDGEVTLHVFVKKSDGDQTLHYYLGEAKADGAFESQMSNGAPVVEMTLTFGQPVETALFDYLQPVLTS